MVYVQLPILAGIGVLYYLFFNKYVVNAKNRRSKKLEKGSVFNSVFSFAVFALSLFVSLTIIGKGSDAAMNSNMDFMKNIYNVDRVLRRHLFLLLLGVFCLEISSFIVASKLSAKKNEYKNLKLEKVLMNGWWSVFAAGILTVLSVAAAGVSFAI